MDGSSETRSQNEADHAFELLKGEKEKMTGRKKESSRNVDCKFVVSVEPMEQ